MPDAPRILAFAGSTRSGSYNKLLVRVAVAGAEKAGASVTPIDLRDYPLPLYDFDFQQETGLPKEAVALKELFLAHRGLLIAAPEYNVSLSAVLKNAIDWVSRRGDPDETPLICFKDKVAGIMTACQGAGGRNVQVHLRAILSRIGTHVVASRLTVTGAAEAFDANGTLIKDHYRADAEALGAMVAKMAGALGG